MQTSVATSVTGATAARSSIVSLPPVVRTGPARLPDWLAVRGCPVPALGLHDHRGQVPLPVPPRVRRKRTHHFGPGCLPDEGGHGEEAQEDKAVSEGAPAEGG